MSILAAFIIALLLTLALAPGYRGRPDPITPLIIFFFTLFLIGLAAQFWIVPFGPLLWGIAWVPLLFVVLLFSLAFAAPSPYKGRRNEIKASEASAAESAGAAVSFFIWLLFILLFIAVAIGYFRMPPMAHPIL
jgi:hypothetical protein